MASTFDDWLRALALAGKGPATLYCDRGVAFARTLAVGADLTGASVRGEVRAAPDATGSALATFTVSALSVAGGQTSFTLSLTETVVNALPAPGDGSGVVDLVFDLLWTPSGGTEQRLFGGIFKVIGQVTA